MTGRVCIWSGPARSGKTHRLLQRYAEKLASRTPGTALWLAPTQRSAADVRAKLLASGKAALFAPAVKTFDRFAQEVLEASRKPVRALAPLMQRRLIERLIAEAIAAGRIQHFAGIADRPGFVDLVVAFIRELKRLEIWPETFEEVCRGRGMRPRDAELQGLYAAYQQRLTEHDLYDAEGRFWWARTLLQENPRLPDERLRFVVVDGFTDFTRTQHEILEALARRVEELHVTLPLDDDPGRADLFAKSRQTLERFRERCEKLNYKLYEERLVRRTGSWPAMSHVEAGLFRNPRHARPAPETSGMEIVVASGAWGEVQQVAQRVKRLLVEGDATANPRRVRPGQIAVVFRSLAEAAPLVREAFAEYGIPLALESGRALAEVPAVKWLMALLELHVEDWPFRRLLALVGSNYFGPDGPEWDNGGALWIVERTIREMQIPSGRKELLAQLEQVVDGPQRRRDDSDEAALKRNAARTSRAARTLAIMQRLSDALEKLPERATAGGWGKHLATLAEAIGLRQAIDAKSVSCDDDHAAWTRFMDALGRDDQLWQSMGEDPPAVDRRGLVNLIREIADHESLPEPHDEAGRVRVLSAASVRALDVEYLFLTGLSERSFPAPDRANTLYSEPEYQELAEAGLPLVLRTERSREEMLLFYEVLTRATRRLVLSYAGFDDRAQPLLSSPFLLDVERACGAGRIARHEEPDLGPLPREPVALGPSDARVMAVAEALEGQPVGLSGLASAPHPVGLSESLYAALEMNVLRGRDREFGPFDGMLEGRAAIGELAERFGPDQHFSPSELEQYASCPYQFYLERVLKLAAPDELDLATDYMDRGTMLHNVLSKLHGRIAAGVSGIGSPSDLDDAAYAELVAAVLDEVLPAESPGLEPVAAALREINRRQIVEWLVEYQAQHRNYDRSSKTADRLPVPTWFEVSFGLRESCELPSTAEPLVLEHGTSSVRIAGRIDRLDVGELNGEGVFNVIDYKTSQPGRFTAKAVREGELLQLSLYAMAAERLLLADRKVLPWRIGYWFVAARGFAESLTAHTSAEDQMKQSADWQYLKDELPRRVASLVAGITSGQFPMFSNDDKCTSRCLYRTVCRVNHVRALEKTWQPPVPPR